jgi:hypothetical protein
MAFQLQEIALRILFDYLPIAIATAGVVISIRAFSEKKNSGFLVLTFVLIKPILDHVGWWLSKRSFVPTQIDANTWTAPVRHVDVLEPLFLAMLAFAVWLIYRKYSTAITGAQSQKEEGTSTEKTSAATS